MSDQKAFLGQSQDLTLWLGEMPSVSADAADQMRAIRTAIDERWLNYVPLERDAVFDDVVALYCASVGAGRVDLASSADYASLRHRVNAAEPAKDHRHGPRPRHLPEARLEVLDFVCPLVTLYGDTKPAQAWRKAFMSDISHEKLVRLGGTGRESLRHFLESLLANRQALLAKGQVLPPLNVMPTGDEALADAQYAVQPRAQRLRAYTRLLRCFADLYRVRADKEHLDFQAAADVSDSPVARKVFARLGRRQPLFLSFVRNKLFSLCEHYQLNQMHYGSVILLPRSDVVLHQLFARQFKLAHVKVPAPSAAPSPVSDASSVTLVRSSPFTPEARAHSAMRSVDSNPTRRERAPRQGSAAGRT